MKLEERIVGGILGVVVGDALGLPVQFLSREEVRHKPITEMTSNRTLGLPPGTWSDDSSLTLCLMESLTEKGYSPSDIGNKFIRWYQEGYWTPFGKAFDIGRATRRAMENLLDGIEPLQAGLTDERSNGNGSLMRILPAALYFAKVEDREMIKRICEISCITHAHPRSQLACCLYALIVKELLAGKDPASAYNKMREKTVTLVAGNHLADELPHFKRVIDGTLPKLPEVEINSGGYVVDTLEAAIWCLLNNNNFTDTLLAAVNLGEDTDTVGAVTGGLAGVYYGYNSIPQEWLRPISHLKQVTDLSKRFVRALA
ncbi:ADP-ribosylglycohydrolase family protein [Desulforamulus aeronauticus]|uniref:ADP-ribosylglycohydrolase n=1 Tax=Desulforamulus aeronauticus DSM 10349 TaxID=1121421 RepID=A0A1M6UW04_9FIRM|nr:ADP-ribosylglycohydrolase family protein [Desulforamulus aeronauticus]SHK73315.1 ADP-ribosylglycohydrolase [Desulforamulus aeronauticus DSM 10349]